MSLAFVWGIHRWTVDSQHKGPVTQKMFPFDDVIMNMGVVQQWPIQPYSMTGLGVSYVLPHTWIQ